MSLYGSHQHVVRQHARHTQRVGFRVRIVAGFTWNGAEHGEVAGSVPAALELQDLRPAGECPRRTQRQECCVGSGRHVPNLLGARNGLDHLLREPDSRFVQEVKRRPLANLALDGFQDPRVAVTNQHGPGTHQVVDVLPAVNADQMTAAPFANHNILGAREHQKAKGAAAEHVACEFKEFAIRGGCLARLCRGCHQSPGLLEAAVTAGGAGSRILHAAPSRSVAEPELRRFRNGEDQIVSASVSESSRVRIALIGAGGFGTYTTELIDRQPEIELVGVADTDGDKARRLGRDRGVPFWADHRGATCRVRLRRRGHRDDPLDASRHRGGRRGGGTPHLL